ncbi:MAG: D,D-dipeptide ABC transporter permease, partial [Chloroflexi bacterium]|nr:D,D-dipeptide ABC transporter permease [Chloroflexota bacterium]
MDQRTLNRLRQALRRDPLVILSLGWLLLITAATIGAPWISSHDPTGVEYSHALRPPSFEHLLGADNFGRDVFTRVIYGGRASLATA